MENETEGCAHIRPEDNAGCPFDCKTWLRPFPWNSSNARFENGGIVEFMELLENLPSVNKIFQTLDLVYDQKLFKITENVTRNEQDWKDKLVESLVRVKSLPSLTSPKELEVFKQVVSDKLKQYVAKMEVKGMPNVLIITPKESDEGLQVKMIYSNTNKRKQHLTFDDFALIHKSMPELKSLNIDSLNMVVSGEEQVIVNNNELESVHISLASRISSPVSLLVFLLQSYHWHVKTFKLEMEDGKIKPDELNDDGKTLDRAFGEITFQLEHLESIEINNFYHSINIAAFLRNLGSTSCKLKHLTLLRQPDSKSIFYYMVKDHANTLQSLTVSTHKYQSILDLSKIKSLKKLSYKWDSLDEQLDILKVLMALPNLEYLELGHNRIQGDWVFQVVNADIYPNLTTLSLSNVNIKETAFKDLNQQLPNLKNIHLTQCRIGTNRQETDSTISFGDYILDTLVLDKCKLFYSRKEAKPKGRMIARYMLSMEYHEPYAATMKYDSSGEESQSKLYIDEGYFVYDVSGNLPEISNANVLRIKANMIRSFSISKNATEYVAFCPEKEITDLKQNSSVIQPEKHVAFSVEEHEVVEILDDSDDDEVVMMEETQSSSETPSVNVKHMSEYLKDTNMEHSASDMDMDGLELSPEDLIMDEIVKDDALLAAMESIKNDVYVISESEDEEDKIKQVIPDTDKELLQEKEVAQNKEEHREDELQEEEEEVEQNKTEEKEEVIQEEVIQEEVLQEEVLQEEDIQEKEVEQSEVAQDKEEELTENFAEKNDIPNSSDQEKKHSTQKTLFSDDDNEHVPETTNNVDDQLSATEELPELPPNVQMLEEKDLDYQPEEIPDEENDNEEEEDEESVSLDKIQNDIDESDGYSTNSVAIDIKDSSDGEYASDLNVTTLVSSESEEEELVVVRRSSRKKPMHTRNESSRKRARLDQTSDEEVGAEVEIDIEAESEVDMETEINVEAEVDMETEINMEAEVDMDADENDEEIDIETYEDDEIEEETVRDSDEDMKHRATVAEFLANCNDFKAVVRVPLPKRAKIVYE